MSANPKPVEPQREMTEEDFQALMAAEFWLAKINSAGGTLPYQGMWIAVYGEQIIDADRSEEELDRRIEARGDSINLFRVLVRYVHTLDELSSQP